MKTDQEVTAPRAGISAGFLVEDGLNVEDGQPMARLTPDDLAPVA